MDLASLSVLTVLIMATAVLYSAIGQAGASGYLAVMALVGMTSDVMKPTALVLNILVASIAAYKFYRAGSFNRSLFWPLAVGSVPLAFIGGGLTLPDAIYKPVVAAVLLFAAFGLLRKPGSSTSSQRTPFRPWAVVLIGVAIGFLSGLTGTGGGIFLSPLLLWLGWASTRETAGVSAAFIWVNSVAGLLGHLSSVAFVPSFLPLLATAALIGGWIGAEIGSKRLAPYTMQRVLATVLVISGLRLLFIRDK